MYLRKRLKSTSGASLVMIALALVMLIGFVGLALDINLALSAITDQQELANSMANAALDAYLGDGSADENQRLDSAKQRAQDIARLPANRPLFRDFVVSPGVEPEVCLKQSPSDSCPDTAHAMLIPGLYIVENNALHSCASPDTPPCFIPGMPLGEQATAFQVELRQTDASPIRSMFAKILGLTSLRTSAASTSAVVPRLVVLAVDVSSSVESTSHNKSGPLPTRRRSAYKLDPGITCNPDHTVSRDPCAIGFFGNLAGAPITGQCLGIIHSDLNVDTKYHVMWAGTHADLSATGGVRLPNTQYKSDYQCWSVDDDGTGPANYLIDLPNGQYSAQPLGTILDSIDQALTSFRLKRNAGDRVQLQFFDTTVRASREIPTLYADGSNTVTSGFALASVDEADPNYVEIKAVTSGDLEARFKRHAVFPRIDPIDASGNGGVFSNVNYSAYRAMQALSQDTNAYARRIVVQFSDFISNCGGHERDPVCRDTWSWVGDATLHLLDRVIHPFFLDRKISFNPILFGEYVKPHTMLPFDGQGGCMWDENEIRNHVPSPYINGNYYNRGYVNFISDSNHVLVLPPDPHPTDPNEEPTFWALPNIVWMGAKDTGGVFGVIRPCCRRAGACMNVKDVLNQSCQAADAEVFSEDPNSSWGCPRNPTGDHCQAGFVWDYNDFTDPDTGQNSSYIDNRGRLICDPEGRTETTQMRDYMENILGSNSIVLVETEKRIGF